MTGATLVRYIGPLAAYRGAIGWSADGGAIIGGRLRRGEVEPAVYRVTAALYAGNWSTWAGAAAELARCCSLSDSSRHWSDVRDAAPDPSGLEMTVGEHVYRLEVC